MSLLRPIEEGVEWGHVLIAQAIAFFALIVGGAIILHAGFLGGWVLEAIGLALGAWWMTGHD